MKTTKTGERLKENSKEFVLPTPDDRQMHLEAEMYRNSILNESLSDTLCRKAQLDLLIQLVEKEKISVEVAAEEINISILDFLLEIISKCKSENIPRYSRMIMAESFRKGKRDGEAESKRKVYDKLVIRKITQDKAELRKIIFEE